MSAAIETRDLDALRAAARALRERLDRAERELEVLKRAAKVKEAGQ